VTVAVLVPVLNRPHRVTPTLAAFTATAPGARVLFLADPDDLPEQRALHDAEADHALITGGYAAKIAAGVRLTTEPLVFLAADDLIPLPGWYDAARALLVGGVEVVGVNDLIPRRPGRERHATHFLMTRSYAERPCIDGTPGPLHHGYDHSFVDDELIATATRRGVYAYAENAHVQHLHPMTGTAADDTTYRKGRARFRADRQLFHRRSRLWT
jgi:hypothetical protein